MNELDELMRLDPLELAASPEKLDRLIAHYRKQRADFEAGVKPKKEKPDGPKIDFTSLTSVKAPAGERTRR